MKQQDAITNKVHWFWWFAFWVLFCGGPLGWLLMIWLWNRKLRQ